MSEFVLFYKLTIISGLKRFYLCLSIGLTNSSMQGSKIVGARFKKGNSSKILFS